MATSVKTKSKKSIVHKCTMKETIERQGILIERIGKVTLGNGTPEDGLLFKFRKFLIEHDEIKNDITEIKGMVSNALKDAETTRHAFELYKTHEEGTIEGKKEKENRDIIARNIKATESRDKWQKVIWIIMGLIALAGIWINIWLNNKDNTVIKDKIDNLGDPVVTNPRGEFVPLPEGFTLKMWPNDFDNNKIQDTIR